MTFSWFWAGGGAGAWSVLRILFGIDALLAVLGGWWHAHGASWELMNFSWFWAGGGDDAWSVLRILFGIDDLLMGLGGGGAGAERPENSVRNR